MERKQEYSRATVRKRERLRKLSHGPPVRSEELDQAVFQFLEEERAEGRVVRNKDLLRKVIDLASAFNVQSFAASRMWLKH